MEIYEKALQYLNLFHESCDSESVDRAALVEQFLMTTYEIGRQIHKAPSLRESAAFRDYAQQSAELLVPYAHWLKLFILKTENIFVLGFQHDEWLDVCRRRSAVEFLTEIAQDTPFEIYANTLDTSLLDHHIIEVGIKEGYLDKERIPDGIPTEHWWWWYPESPPDK